MRVRLEHPTRRCHSDNLLSPEQQKRQVTEPSPTKIPGAVRPPRSRTVYVEWIQCAYVSTEIVHHREGTGTWKKGDRYEGLSFRAQLPVCHPERSEGSRSFVFPLSVIHTFPLLSSPTRSGIHGLCFYLFLFPSSSTLVPDVGNRGSSQVKDPASLLLSFCHPRPDRKSSVFSLSL